MMLKVFSSFIFLDTIISTQLDDQTKESNFINCVISAFNNEEIFQHWVKSDNLKYEKAFDYFKDIVSEIKDILSVIDKPEYKDFKNLIVDTLELLIWDRNPFPYSETCMITKSIADILNLNDKYKKEGYESCESKVNEKYYDEELDKKGCDYVAASKKSGINELFTKIVLNEYEYIYIDSRDVIFTTVKPYLYQYKSQLHEFTYFNIKSSVKDHHWNLANFFKKKSRNIVKDILDVGKTGRTFIFASKKGMSFSRKCFWDKSSNLLDGEFKILFPRVQYRDFEFKSFKDKKQNINFFKEPKKRTFVCNKSMASLLVPLIHFFTTINNVDSEYEIFLNEKGLYEINWSSSKLLSVESLKNYYWKKEVPASFYPLKKVGYVAFLKDYLFGYSIIKIYNEDTKPITMRLMVLSCGHQLGFGLLDSFFNYFYGYNIRKIKCPVCSSEIEIIGSHNIPVYVKKE